MRKKKCKVCGAKLPLKKEKLKIIFENKHEGLETLTRGTGTKLYEAYDCEVCGCQNVVGVRYQLCAIEFDYGKEDLSGNLGAEGSE
ncbi:MAG: hypothetical protein PHC62_03935 [Candidatus Izemoplasmatales bacterium]|nr:hypothetical protein [Candidatus Izemoplasmatales bacterium]